MVDDQDHEKDMQYQLSPGRIPMPNRVHVQLGQLQENASDECVENLLDQLP